MVVTATPVATPAEQLGASVSVVNGQDFQTYHYPTVDEALRSVPGVEIRRSGAYGKTTSVTIRGANANQVQVLVDGLRVKSPTLGQVDLSDISPDLIERIEETPDTVVTLTTGTRYVVEESIDQIVARICAYRAAVFNLAMRSADHQETGRPAHLRVVRDTPVGAGD